MADEDRTVKLLSVSAGREKISFIFFFPVSIFKSILKLQGEQQPRNVVHGIGTQSTARDTKNVFTFVLSFHRRGGRRLTLKKNNAFLRHTQGN